MIVIPGLIDLHSHLLLHPSSCICRQRRLSRTRTGIEKRGVESITFPDLVELGSAPQR